MAVTTFSVNDPLTNKLYSKKLAVQSILETYVRRFMGTTANHMIQVRNETMKAAGDRITVGLRVKLQGAGVLAPGTLEGNEESLTFRDDSITINKLRHAYRCKAENTIEQQRVPFELREEGLDAMAQWWAERYDFWFANQACGMTADGDSFGTDPRYTGLQATIAPDTAHVLRFASDTTDSDIANDLTTRLRLDHIDAAVEMAKRANPLVRPIRYDGQDKYVGLIHTFDVNNLRNTTVDGSWFDIKAKGLQGGKIDDNEIYTGALGEYNNVVLHEWDRITQGAVTTTAVAHVRRAILCGAQACWAAFGQGFGPGRFQWAEEMFDYGEELGIAAGCIGGLKKSRFNSADFAIIQIPHRAVANTTLALSAAS